MDLNAMFGLTGRVALVTGSSRGIGRALALALAAAGAKVAVHGSHREGPLDQTVAEIRQAGGTAEGLAADLSDSAATRGLVAECRTKLGAPDILILNASIQSYQTIEDFTAAEWERQGAVNLRSSFELIQEVLPEMRRKRWGRLLAIGSVNQWRPSPRLAIYASTKAALVNIMLGCARQYAADGVTANNLAPGVIVTDRNREALADDAFREKVLGMIPAGRFGTAEDCAGLALLICSEAGAYITGADIPVAGGMQL